MNELLQAIDLIYLFRIKGDEDSAWKLGYQTDGSTDESREYESEPTKDGNVKSPGEYTAEHSIQAFMVKDDEYLGKMKEQIRARNPKPLEVWEIDRSDIDDADVDQLPAEYSTDYISNISRSAASEGRVELDISTEVEGKIISGYADVTDELKALLQQITEEQEFVQPMNDEG